MSAPPENENTVFRLAQAGKTAELDREFEEAVSDLRKRLGQSFPMLIAGREATASKTFDDLDPSTGEVIARFPRGTEADVDAAVKAAKT
ncbi:MAG TPA: aldehyde dehydrogenase family protein, partial [Candidatus Thermoplasmatota archaeon]|nr:aldehyde dehydrogenase family protein [Candidatus Thermoplasmatota archaeon]